ncbi:ABC transporter permease [Embleya sp. NBC_00888]|uniref:ABC transporter permease n=1 Tax=Embleya sp. NBC_00888 TaxID=2975960 RepID=UPI003866F9A7|nr:ABC transporter permease [Embleya sp. NBC_00888]
MGEYVGGAVGMPGDGLGRVDGVGRAGRHARPGGSVDEPADHRTHVNGAPDAGHGGATTPTIDSRTGTGRHAAPQAGVGSGTGRIAAAQAPDPEIKGPPPELKFKRRTSLIRGVRELWHSRELVRTLAERDLKARYKQAVLGFAWAIITPVLLMVVFTVVFQRVGNLSDTAHKYNVPYPLFSYLGLLPWTFFMSSVTQGSSSLVSNGPLLNKVYCPREVFPFATVIVATVDMLIASSVLAVLFAAYTTPPAATSWALPILLLIQFEVTLGVVLVLSAAVVYFRDIRHVLPLLMQMGMFATPVAYGMDQITKDWLLPYVILNPLAAVIDGYRRAILYGQQPDWELTGAAAASATVLLFVGYKIFKKLEAGIADVA